MKKIKVIENVTYGLIKTKTDSNIIGVNNELKILDYKNELKNLPQSILENQLYKIDKKSIFYRSDEKIMKIDLTSFENSLLYLNDSNSDIWIFNEDFVFEAKKTDNRREYKFNFVEIKNKKIRWTDISKVRFVSKSNDYLLFTDFLGGIYNRRKIDDGKEIWSLDFSENKIAGNVLLIDDILIFPTTNQDLIGIEIETGKELWRLSNCNLYHQQQPNKNYLVGLSSNTFGDNFYQVIDPISGVKLIDKKFENFFYETTPNLACITERHYYFISNVLGDGTGTKSERITHLGCINLQTHVIEWIEKIGATSDMRNGYQKPEINYNKIYLLDAERRLHIYELGHVSDLGNVSDLLV